MKRASSVLLLVVPLLAGTACKGASSPSGAKQQDPSGIQAPSGADAASSDGEGETDGGEGLVDGANEQPNDEAGATDAAPADAGGEAEPDASAAPDAGTAPQQDAGTDGGQSTDAAVNDADVDLSHASGSCCSAHDTPGCSDADLQVCVCEVAPTCCTESWNAGCVLLVEQKYCQPGVRDCVCGTGEGQWGRTSCCTTDWTDVFCDQVAQSKCGALPGCR